MKPGMKILESMGLKIRHIAYAIATVLTFVAGASCMKENAGVDSPKYGEKAFLSLNALTGNLDKVIVKSWYPNDENERFVNTLRVYVFSESGSLVGYKYFSKDNLSFEEDRDSNTGYDYTSELTGIPVTTGRVYIYGIANAVTTQYYVEDEKILNGDASLTLEEFLQATCTRQKSSYNPQDNTFVMSGAVYDGKAVTVERVAGTVNAKITSPTDDDSQRLKLYKVISKNKFTITTADGIKFEPDYVEINNVPQKFGLAKNSNASASDFENFDRIVVDESTFSFYLPENLQTTDATISSFNDREKNAYDSDDNKSFVNAPANATYMVIHGNYTAGNYSGNLSYTVHLGDFSHDISDFLVSRNCNYEYTLTIKGVNNFIAESKKDGNADDPGSEGILINSSSSQLLEVDSHYESRVLQFTMDEVYKLVVTDKFGYILKIKTPFCETVRMLIDGDGNIYEAADYKSNSNPTVLTTLNADGLPSDPSKILVSGEADYSWVHFMINTSDYAYPCAYPGTGNEKLLTVFELLRDMFKAGKNKDTNFFNSSKKAYLTCFIDENYYVDKNWTEYVNQTEDRKVYFANEFYTSEDKHSSYAEAKYLISQKSIWTFYANDATLSPYGTESISEETGKTVSAGTNSSTQDWNARASALSNNPVSKKYSSYTATKIVGKQSLYLSSAYQACMSRNRDEDGDGYVDADEVKWYLASVDQYRGLWIGEKVLPTDIKLFQPTQENWAALKVAYDKSSDAGLSPWHYFTASSQNTFWAEEGCSTSANSQAQKVRCVRTLESGGNGLKEADAFYTSSTNSDNTTDITLRISDDVKRGYQSGPMSPSYERGEETTNNVYTKFRVAASNLSNAYSRSAIINSSNGGAFIKSSADVCNTNSSYGGAWRVPNQKEISVMYLAGIRPGTIWSNTSFTGMNTGYYKNGQKNAIGFTLTSGGMMSIAQSGDIYVRCVMDVKD